MEHKSHIANILRHSVNISIAEVLGRLLKTSTFETVEPEFEKQRKELINTLLNPPNENIELENQWSVLCGLAKENIELPFLLRIECISSIYAVTVSKIQARMKAGLKLLIALMETSLPPPNTLSSFIHFPAVESTEKPKADQTEKLNYSNISKCAAMHMGFFKSFLDEPPIVYIFAHFISYIGSSNSYSRR